MASNTGFPGEYPASMASRQRSGTPGPIQKVMGVTGSLTAAVGSAFSSRKRAITSRALAHGCRAFEFGERGGEETDPRICIAGRHDSVGRKRHEWPRTSVTGPARRRIGRIGTEEGDF